MREASGMPHCHDNILVAEGWKCAAEGKESSIGPVVVAAYVGSGCGAPLRPIKLKNTIHEPTMNSVISERQKAQNGAAVCKSLLCVISITLQQLDLVAG